MLARNGLGVILTFIWVLSILAIFEYLHYKQKIDHEESRKFIHIGVSNAWIIAVIFMDRFWYFVIPLLLFAVFNFIIQRTELLKGFIGDKREPGGDLGAVYFPISVSIIAVFTWWDGITPAPLIGGLGTLIMGYGDGLAGLLGKKFGKKPIFKNSPKTVFGSIVMFTISFVVSAIIFTLVFHFSALTLLFAVGLALFATFVEAITPNGLDNLTVPILSSGIALLIGRLEWLS